MRSLFIVGWLLLPIAAGIWHHGPGQDRMLMDEVAGFLSRAEQSVAAENWDDAVAQYDEALKRLPAQLTTENRGIRLERAKAQMNAQQLPAAHQDLKSLVDELKDDPKADAALLADARTALASAQYYMTWLLRLEGEPRELWEPEIEGARQNYRLLAEQSEAKGDADGAQRNRADLEASIRLARMDLSELQGLPLPSQ